jgi:hypothetical protein
MRAEFVDVIGAASFCRLAIKNDVAHEAARTLGVPQRRRISLVPVRGRDEYQRQTRRIPFA